MYLWKVFNVVNGLVNFGVYCLVQDVGYASITELVRTKNKQKKTIKLEEHILNTQKYTKLFKIAG